MRTTIAALLLTLFLAGCGSPPTRPKAFTDGQRLLSKGVIAFHNDELADAAGFFTRALQHYEGLDDRDGQLQSRINLVEVALAVGNLKAAGQHLEQAEQLAVGELAGYQTRLTLLRSSLLLAQGDTAQAAELSESLLPTKLGGKGDGKVAEPLQRLALINRTEASFFLEGDDPSRWVERLSSLVKGDALSEARLARFQAVLAQSEGNNAKAAELLQHALDICKELPSRSCIAATLEEQGAFLLEREDLAGAQLHFQRALGVRLALLDQGRTTADLNQLAQISERAGRAEEASNYRKWAGQLQSGEAVNWSRMRRETLPQ